MFLFSGWLFGNEVVSFSPALSPPLGSDCKKNLTLSLNWKLTLYLFLHCGSLWWVEPNYLSITCLYQEELSTAAPQLSSSTNEVEKKKVHTCGRRLSHEDHREIGGAVEQLGLKLLEKLPVSPQQPNVILSPLSLAFALAHLTLGWSDFTQLNNITEFLQKSAASSI